MDIAIIKNNLVVALGNYRVLFPYTVFPDSGPSDEWLLSNSCMKVSHTKDCNWETQTLVSSLPYIENDTVYTVIVQNKTPEETETDQTVWAANLRFQRNWLLKESDWTQLLDAPVDRTAWAVYRQNLRDIPLQEEFPRNVTWPNSPDQQEN